MLNLLVLLWTCMLRKLENNLNEYERMYENISLMAIEPISQRIWDNILKVLQSEGYTVVAGRIIRAWKQKCKAKGLVYADGVEIKKIWLGPQKWSYGVFGRRFYLDNEVDKLDYKDVTKQLCDKIQGEIAFNNEVKVISTLLHYIKNIHMTSVDLVNTTEMCRRIFVKDKKFYTPKDNLSEIYKVHGFHSPPISTVISLCPMFSVPQCKFSEFKHALYREINKYNLNISLTEVSTDIIKRRLHEINNSNLAVEPSGCVIFLLPNKKHKIPDKEFEMLMELQQLGIPFRRAYADDPFAYSVVDQFPSIITALGGQPHIVDIEIKGKKAWSIGIDISHDTIIRASTLAVTLIDSNGKLVCCWKRRLTKLDETINTEVLSEILIECANVLEDYDQDINIVILRDGRMFENENVEIYKRYLGFKISFIEYRKRGNPTIIASQNGKLKKICSSTVNVPGTHTLFTTSFKSSLSGKPATAKIVLSEKSNLLNLTYSDVSNFLAASTASPSLGLKARNLPAAIYWADGIAGISINDLRFAGQANIKMIGHQKTN